MHFPVIIILTTVLTITSIFGFYKSSLPTYVVKIFLDKPQIESSPGPSVAASSQLAQELPNSPPQESATPSPAVLKSASPASSVKPSPRPSAATGSITQITPINQTTQTGSGLSGSLFVNGSPASGTSVVIAVREHGSSAASQVVQNGITPQTGSSWSWNGGTSGKTYDVVAILKGTSSGQDIDYAKSPTYNLTVPTSSFGLTINVGYAMSAPTGQVTITCTTHYSNNTWAATVNFPQVSEAQYYWLKVGSTSGASDIVNYKSSSYTQGVTLNDSVGYFAQYAISSVSNPTDYQWSAFSTPTQIRCP